MARSEIRRLISLLEAGSDEASALREALARAAVEETAAVRKAAEQAQAALQHVPPPLGVMLGLIVVAYRSKQADDRASEISRFMVLGHT